MLKVAKTLGARIIFVLVIIFICFALVSSFIFFNSNRSYEREVTQTIHSGLAQHVVDEHVFFDDDQLDTGTAKQSFHNLMILGPNFEFYLLDNHGKILAFDSKPELLKKKSIDLQPIKAFLSEGVSSGPILGDDPKSENKKKVFSVAKIEQDGQTHGFLYVVIGSQARDEVEQRLFIDKLLHSGFGLFITAVVLTGILAFFAVARITRPLQQLTSQVRTIKQNGFENFDSGEQGLPHSLERWDDNSSNDIDILGAHFREALTRLEQQYKHVISIDELRKELLSHVSHDLRTPLASLLGYLETWEMQQGKLSEEQSREYIGTARKNAQQIFTLIEQLFDLAHLDSDNVTIKKERVAVAELVQDVLQRFSLIAQQAGIELDVCPKDSNIEVYVDIEMLERVFINLIENAIRHTPKHGKITITLVRHESQVAIEVRDTGIGIPAEDIGFVFDPHFKAGNSVRENTAHGGMGLAITKRLLELHDSEIEVQSAPDAGTCFRFSLQAA